MRCASEAVSQFLDSPDESKKSAGDDPISRAISQSLPRSSLNHLLPPVGAFRAQALVGSETDSDFSFRSDRSGENRLELGEASFANSNYRRNALEQP